MFSRKEKQAIKFQLERITRLLTDFKDERDADKATKEIQEERVKKHNHGIVKKEITVNISGNASGLNEALDASIQKVEQLCSILERASELSKSLNKQETKE